MNTNIDYFQIDEEIADERSFSGVEREITSDEYIDTEPFDPSSISISSKTIALDTVLRRIKNNTIRLSPDFQRNYVWDIERKSQLIESMILRIPLPMFYVSEDREGIWEVVDGLQRLSTIRDFILGPDGDGKGFDLAKLEFWGSKLNTRNFFKLEQDPKAARIVNNILETELNFTIINPETPEKVKRNIFKRLNTGGIRLSEQEIRHALYQGHATVLLKKLVKTQEYEVATQNTVNDSRMAGRELILRFIAFNLIGREEYTGNTDDYLSSAMQLLNGEKHLENVNIDPVDLEEKFKKGLMRTTTILGEHSFRKSKLSDNRKSPINKSLFELWINMMSSLSDREYYDLVEDRSLFLESYYKLLDSEEFENSISRHGASVAGVGYRWRALRKLIDGTLNK
ncbi:MULTISPECIES: DUF262 domain-containing protein [Pseudoalteromonas]|uniref:GmrSD restriction endonucleases N-terminal domain-containing protein n=1 Tax=Pseudoalteromonas amylolytica TaxID=1859457 RepID=A0A1S1MRW2_9GAMM|nr:MULTISPECIES: DUF262 domain-containing protein [Pseudoalteromonas]OHU86490.1 hypothetical protein BFC16_13300 [Pseudoalteromonas sp. JW3]OHU88985.1 hypothetical protein BET10_19460 [Pseudoalteromonas amylolytica]